MIKNFLSLHRHKFKWILAFGLFGVLALWFVGYRLEPNRLIVERINLKELGSLHFALIADMQYKARDFGLMQKVVETINQENPDFVLVAGDWVETPDQIKPLMAHMEKIKAPIYGVLGNHDYWAYKSSGSFRPDLANALDQMGGEILVNSSIPLSKDWVLVGLDDGWAGKPDFKKAFRGTEGKKRLFLFHEPEIINYLQEEVVLSFAGHSHGGQVRLPWIGALHVPGSVGKFDRGLFQLPNSKRLYVTSGIGRMGTWTPRFLCPPEVVVFKGR